MDEKTKNSLVLPRHIGFIMDGNGRWATARGLERAQGHKAGAQTFRTISTYCAKLGIQSATFYAFSTENWKRPAEEVEGIMNLLRDYLKDAENFKQENIKVKFIGDPAPLAEDIKELMKKDEDGSKDATGLKLNIAINYGGRDELVHAVKKIIADGVPMDEITEQTISDRLYTANMPDPDFIIRPSGEYRTSNYLLWQSAYSEYWFSDVLWPDFTPKHLEKAIEDYNRRNRRFGGV